MPRLNFITLCSGDYWLGFAVLVESFRQNSALPITDYQFNVYTNEALPDFVKTWLDQRSESIFVHNSKILDAIEVKVPQKQPNLTEALRKIALIGEGESDPQTRNFLIDTDMICLNALAGIQDIPPFSAAPDAMLQFLETKDPEINDGEINTGFFSYTPSAKVRQELIELYNANPQNFCNAADQDVINKWLKNSGIKNRLGNEWNMPKYNLRDKRGKARQDLLKKCKLLHLIKTKPWNSAKKIEKFKNQRWLLDLERVWWFYYRDSGMHCPGHYFSQTYIHPYLRYINSLAITRFGRLKNVFTKRDKNNR